MYCLSAPLHEWVEGKLAPKQEPEVTPPWSADPQIKKREAELDALLAQGPPERGNKDAPITWLLSPESFAPANDSSSAGDSEGLTLT